MAYTPASSNTVTSPNNAAYLSLYSGSFEPAVIRELYEKYGKQFGVLDFLRLSGQEISLTRDSITSFSRGAQFKPIKVKSAVAALTANSGHNEFQFFIHEDDYDTNSKTFVRVGDTLFIPGYYFGKTYDVQARVYEVGASDSAETKAVLFDGTIAAADMTQTFPANGYLQVGPTAYGRGSGQPSARSRGFYSDTFNTAISKETVNMHGGVQAQQLYFEVPDGKGGIKGVWGMHWADAEFSLDYQMGANIWQGNENDNAANLTETDVDSADSTIKGTKGAWLHAADNGVDHEYVDMFTVKDIDSIYDAFRTKGVICSSALLGVGDKLYGQAQDAAHDYVSQYSGGTDVLTENMTKLGFTAHKWNRRGIDFKLVNFAELSNHQTFGANQKSFWLYAGLAIPDEQVTIEDREGGIYNSEGAMGGKVTIPNMAVGYLSNNQEDRKRIVTDVAGVNGFGFKATDQYDRSQLFLLSEYGLIANETDKWVRLMKDGTY